MKLFPHYLPQVYSLVLHRFIPLFSTVYSPILHRLIHQFSTVLFTYSPQGYSPFLHRSVDRYASKSHHAISMFTSMERERKGRSYLDDPEGGVCAGAQLKSRYGTSGELVHLANRLQAEGVGR